MSGHDKDRDKPLSFRWYAGWLPKNFGQFDDAIRLSTHQRNVSIVRRYIVAQAVAVARKNPERWISYSRSARWYDGRRRWRSRYWPVVNMHRAVVSAADELATAGWLENRVMPPGHLKIQSTMRATPELLALFEEHRIPLTLAQQELIVVRNADGHPVDYNDTRETNRMRRQMEAFNEAARATVVHVNGQPIIEGERIVLGKDKRGQDIVVGAATLQGVRIFNRGFDFGGRLYGPSIQNAPEELRAGMTINGCAVVEPDYHSLHPQLLYALCGRPLPERPYDIDGWDYGLTKKAFNTLLNAKCRNDAVLSIAEEIGGFTRGHREQAKCLIAEVERKHPAVAQYFCSGIGLQFQRTDSEIMNLILTTARKDGEALLPVHDSVLARQQYANRAIEIMDESFEKVTGKRPVKKRSSTRSLQIRNINSLTPTLSYENAKKAPQNGGVVLGWAPGPPPGGSWLPWVSLAPGLASLAVVVSFYGAASIDVYEQAA